MDILLLDSDIEYCQSLLNALSSLNKKTRISFIAHSISEILDIFNPNIILADYEFYNNELENKFPDCEIIYLCNESDNSLNTICKTDLDLIIKTIEHSIKNISDEQLEKAIISEVSFLGYNFSHVGTQHLIETLKLLYNSEENYYNINLKKDIFPRVSEKFNVPVCSIKGNINYSTNKMFDECEKRKIYSYLGFRFSKRPGAKTVMCAILEKIKLKI